MPIRSLLHFAIAAGLAAPVSAQVPDEPDGDMQALDAVALDVVTVTAQHREQDVMTVPLAVSVIERAAITAFTAGLPDIRVLAARVPSVQAESSFGRTFPRFYIRGLGNTDFDLNATQPVSMVYDDVVLENPVLKGYPLFDLERVEVLRGPQGTLFGRNTPAGVVKFESVRPEREPSGYARFGYGRFDSRQFEGAIGGGVGEVSSARLSALYRNRGTLSENSFIAGDRREDFVERAVRGQWRMQPRDELDVLFQVRARNIDGGSTVYHANLFEPGSNDFVPRFSRDTVAQDARPTSELEAAGASLRASWDFGPARLVSIGAYESVEFFARGDVDGGFGTDFAPPAGPGPIPFPAESGDGIPDHRQLTQEIRLESTAGNRFDWQLGAFWFDESLDIENVSFDTLAGSVRNGFARQHQDTRSWALFGAGSYALGEHWQLAGGLRYTSEEKDFAAERLVSPIGAGPIGPIERRPEDEFVGGDLSLSFAPHEDLLVYGRLARSHRAPAIQGRLLFGDLVSVAETESLDSRELGLKTTLFGDRARLSLTLFDYGVDDIQLTAVGGQANFNTLVNAGSASGRGVELELEARPLQRLQLSVALSYNETELQDEALAVQRCGSPCTVLDPPGPVPGTVLIDGNPLPQAPEWIAHLYARYDWPLAGGEAYLQTDWAYRSEVNFFLYESREFTGDPLLEGGLRLGYAWGGGRYEIAAFGRNILDEIEAVGGVDFNNLTGFVNEPRVVGVEFVLRL